MAGLCCMAQIRWISAAPRFPCCWRRFDADGTVTAQLSKPVILTGSQVPLFHSPEPGKISGITFHTDAFENVCGAVAVARVGIPAVSVFFDNQLMRALSCSKGQHQPISRVCLAQFPNARPIRHYACALARIYAARARIRHHQPRPPHHPRRNACPA